MLHLPHFKIQLPENEEHDHPTASQRVSQGVKAICHPPLTLSEEADEKRIGSRRMEEWAGGGLYCHHHIRDPGRRRCRRRDVIMWEKGNTRYFTKRWGNGRRGDWSKKVNLLLEMRPREAGQQKLERHPFLVPAVR